MKKLLILITLIILTLTVNATTFQLKIEPNERTINLNDTAEFTLTIQHTLEGDTPFDLYSSDVLWDIRTNDALIVPSAIPFKTKLFIKPLRPSQGFFGVPLSIRQTGTDKVITRTLAIELVPPKKGTSFLPSIKGSTTISKEIDPRQETTITVLLENQNNVNTTVKIKLRSDFINKDHETILEPQEKKKLTFNVNLDPLSNPSKDTLRTTVFAFDQRGVSYQFDLEPIEYLVQSYGQLTKNEEIKKQFLKKTKTIVFTANSNVPLTEQYQEQVSLIKRAFTKANPRTVVESGNYAWDIALGPKEQKTIQLTTNYRPLFIFIILLTILTTGYYLFRSPLIIRKKALVIHTREGGISELKIILHLINRSKQTIKQVRVIDLVPRIAELLKKFDIGTLEPNKIMHHEKSGTIVKWTLQQIEPGEERLITYRIRSNLSIIGGLQLSSAQIRFETSPEFERTTKSNTIQLTL